MDKHTPEQRRRNMQAIKSIGTKAEVILAKALWAKGFRYRKNDKTIFGKPDLSFKKYKLAIFIDGEFWHGKDWALKKQKISVNQTYWISKIERNIQRDKNVNEHLTSGGWIVLRFWEKEIKKELAACIAKIELVLLQKNGDF